VEVQRKELSKEQGAELRRARNSAMITKAELEAEEKAAEEAFWGGIRARRERREAGGEDDDRAAREAYAAGKAKREEDARAAEQAAAYAVLPAKIRPHYTLLDLPADATETEVRKAYRKLALKHHPDKNPKDAVAAKEKFTEVAMAYEAVCEHLASSVAAPVGARFAPCY